MFKSMQGLCAGLAFAIAFPAVAQTPDGGASGASTPGAVVQDCPPLGEARIDCLEYRLARQTQMATNARQQMEALRQEAALKDEMIALGIERNAELYSIASEIVEKGISPRSMEPFLQFRRVEMENLMQSYEDRLRQARIYPSTLPPSVQKRMDEELSQQQGSHAEGGGS